ncbi:MAG: helix-turn-helix transcriptional regulator [Candidatus Omnitrophica bacterium]|nr:helix-turn-helix transcriptional regulator [Candidatus Omnitrophota bacterium]
MKKNTGIFWDKKPGREEILKILQDDGHARFIEFAALLLSRTNNPKNVFNTYLSKEIFVKNWLKIKQRMRKNKWNDQRIIFWGEIYKAVRKQVDLSGLGNLKKRPLEIDPDIKMICSQMREHRKKLGISQGELGRKTGLSQQTISYVEQGYINMSLKTLKKISDALGLRLILSNSGTSP